MAPSYGTDQRIFVASTPRSGQQCQRLGGFGEESNIVRDIYQKPDSAKSPNSSADLMAEASQPDCSVAPGTPKVLGAASMSPLFESPRTKRSWMLSPPFFTKDRSTTSNAAVQHLLFSNSDIAKTRLVDTDELTWVPE